MKSLKKYLCVALVGAALISCEKESPATADKANKSQISNGIGGSMAQFTIIDNYLYTVDYKTLNVFHIADAENPVLLEKIDLGIGIETIFPQNEQLFIGTQNGVKVYDVSNPRSPEPVCEFEHVTSCDPVVANENYAFATLRGGTACGGNLNELDIIDLSDLNNPSLVNTEGLINPYGLGLSATAENIVYVCDGYGGLKAYDISDVNNITLKMEMESIEALDVISTDESLIVLSRGGVHQFDATNPVDLVQKSVISVQ